MTASLLTVVVPAFNESAVIASTLERLVSQGDQISEIIVVDNASTDDTAAIVTEFASRTAHLRMIHEPRPGLIPALDSGYEAASTEIVARVDADSLIHPGWASAILDYFGDCPEDVVAVTGPIIPHDTPPVFRRLFTKDENSRVAKSLADSDDKRAVVGVSAVRGTNMAFRRRIWKEIRDLLTTRSDVYEDIDFSICVRRSGYRLAFLVGMGMDISGRRFITSRKDYWEYTACLPRTWEEHGDAARAHEARRVMWLNRVTYLLFWIPNRAWNPESRRYSIRSLLTRREKLGIPTATMRG